MNKPNESLNKGNRPNVIVPLLSTLFSLAFLAFIIYLTITQGLEGWVLALAFVLVILFPLSSWYNSYFSRLKISKQVYNVEEEAKIMVDYAKMLRDKTIFGLEKDNHLDFSVEYSESALLTEFSYDYQNRSFSPLQLKSPGIIMMSLGVSFGGLAIDVKNGQAIGVIGMAPCSIWVKKGIEPPQAKAGRVFVDFKDFKVNSQTVFKYLERADIIYNRKNGWLCFGTSMTRGAEVVKIATNVLLVIRNGDLVALWVKIAPDLVIR